MSNKKDITTIADVELLVNIFYNSIRENELLGPIFNGIIQDRWPQHLQKMYSFWQTVLLEEHTYFGRPFPPHAQLPVNKTHFDSWLGIWHETINNNFEGPKADEAKWRGDKMAVMFLSKIQYYQSNSNIPLV